MSWAALVLLSVASPQGSDLFALDDTHDFSFEHNGYPV